MSISYHICYILYIYLTIIHIYIIYIDKHTHTHTYLHIHTWTAITAWACAILQLSHIASLCVMFFCCDQQEQGLVVKPKQSHKLPLNLGKCGVKLWRVCMYDRWNEEV